ncbi:hypothetical protein E3N88_09391 [Mikania micrantha]|uniref:Zinc finger, CCHC-type n=1 Tax=Mikania micrantha TaxID=192012 RepID=A0A5N6PM00_9ASTR|nr:hypothetical protein E3N88_09391 [Mikania micrantha]
MCNVNNLIISIITHDIAPREPSARRGNPILPRRLGAMKMKPNETASDFAGKLSSIKAKFKCLGGTLKDKVLVRKLLNLVPKKFLLIVAYIKQYQEIEKISFEEAVGRITAFEERLKSQNEPKANYQSKILMASSSSQGHGRGQGKHFNKRENTNERGMGRGNKDKSKFRYMIANKEKDKPESSNLIYDEEPTLLQEASKSRKEN